MNTSKIDWSANISMPFFEFSAICFSTLTMLILFFKKTKNKTKQNKKNKTKQNKTKTKNKKQNKNKNKNKTKKRSFDHFEIVQRKILILFVRSFVCLFVCFVQFPIIRVWRFDFSWVWKDYYSPWNICQLKCVPFRS